MKCYSDRNGMQLLRRLVLALLIVASHSAKAAGAEIVVNYPRPESYPDERSRHPLRLLEAALKRANPAYRVQLYPARMQQGRALVLLQNDEGIDIVSTMTSAEREANLLPIRIPIDKGLIGWRLLLMNKARASDMTGISSLQDLRALKAGQGADWPDTGILRANDLSVYGTSNYEALFKMLENQRIDYFPRSISEIWGEVDARKGLAVEPGLVLRYPAALYYFVRKSDRKLAEDLSAGLEKMIADGSFETMFQEHYGPLIKRSRLKARRIIELKNPLKPEFMPTDRKQLWFRE